MAGGAERECVAIVDADYRVQEMIRGWLSDEGYDVESFDSMEAFGEAAGRERSAVCLDYSSPSARAHSADVRAREPEVALVAMIADGDVSGHAAALRDRVYDQLGKPLERGPVLLAVRRAVERTQLVRRVRRLETQLENQERPVWDALVGHSPPMRELARQIERVLDSEVTVSIFGESGTGKELVARALHHGGRRSQGPFVAINCAAIPEDLHESELFGQERKEGSQPGRIEQAHGGTLFLDEVGELSARTQASLLRALQERSIRRIGGVDDIPVDARIVCSTRMDLDAEVQGGRFREDLYFRLVVYPVRIVPLRQRSEDVPALVTHCLRKYARDVGRVVTRVSAPAMHALVHHSWPGNVRELENAVHRSMLSADGDTIALEHLPPSVRSAGDHAPLDSGGPTSADIVPMRELERRAIQRALRATGGSVEKAARLLGMGRATLYRRLAKYESLNDEIAPGR